MRDQLGSWTPGNWAPDEISSWTPSVTDQIKAFLADNLFGGGREGYRSAGGLTEGLSLLGVPGAAMDAGDAAGAFGKGNFVEGGILSAATLASLVPVAGRPVSKALRSLAGKRAPAANPGPGAGEALGLLGSVGKRATGAQPLRTLISSQRYLDDAVVEGKRRAKDYTVKLSPTFTNDGEPVQVVLDGHHALAAAKADGVSPKFEVIDAQADDRIGLLDRGKIDDFLEATYQDSDYYDLATGRDFSWGEVLAGKRAPAANPGPGAGEGLGAVAGALKRVPFGGATPPRLAVADLRRQANIERFGYDPNEIPPAPTRAGIKAYHGSPHDFDKFDLSNIGTGEGAQAYGHGMYFAGAPDVSRSYRDTLVRSQGKDETYRIGKEDLQDVYSRLSQKADSMPASKAEAQYNKMALLEDLANDGDVLAIRARAADGAYDDATVAWFEKSIAPKFNRSGALYEVNINADPEGLLDWDKPLSEQSENVRAALENLRRTWTTGASDPSGNLIYNSLKENLGGANQGQAASEALGRAGIPGLKYYDGMSRNAGEGTSNYVVFDDALIEILKKYGLTGLLAGGGATYLATQPGGDPKSGLLAPDL